VCTWRGAGFTGLGFEQEIPHHSTFSKNRHGRLQESNLFQELFERMVEPCIAAGLVEGEPMSVDGSFILANASHHSRIPREPFTEAELWGAEVPGRSRAGKWQRRAPPSARQGVDHRPGFDVADQGKSRCRTGLLR